MANPQVKLVSLLNTGVNSPFTRRVTEKGMVLLPAGSQSSAEKQKVRRICCVPNCHTTGYEEIEGHGKPSYHRFPPVGDPLRKTWIAKIKRDENENFMIKDHTVVCFLHFKEDMLEFSKFSKKRYLKEGAIPSVFDCWKGKVKFYNPSKERSKNKLQSLCRQEKSSLSDLEQPQNNIDDSCIPDEQILPLNNQNESCQSEIQTDCLISHIEHLQSKINTMELTNKNLKAENERLQADLKESVFSVDNIPPNEFQFYTGFANRAVFNHVLGILNPGSKGENVVMVSNKDEDIHVDVQKQRRPRKLSPENQFFLLLCRLKVGFFEMDLAHRFKVSIGTVSNILVSWVNFCYLRLGSLNIWPSRVQIDQTMPSSFKLKYPSTRVIIDCTEVKVEMPSSLLLKSQTYSSYKGTNTLKGLIGIAPCGSVTFISQLYFGNISDQEITERSGLLGLPFDKGDSLMADKGFDIQDLLDPIGVKLNIPPFLSMRGQMSNDDVKETQSIASERIHVERAINKIKSFHIFDQVLPMSLFGSINQIWTVCALLTLFQDPIISCPGSELCH